MVLNKFYFEEANEESKGNSYFFFKTLQEINVTLKRKKVKPYESEGVGTQGISKKYIYAKYPKLIFVHPILTK